MRSFAWIRKSEDKDAVMHVVDPSSHPHRTERITRRRSIFPAVIFPPLHVW